MLISTLSPPRYAGEALYEAILLAVVIALIGFWEWRSALLMACAHTVGRGSQQLLDRNVSPGRAPLRRRPRAGRKKPPTSSL